MMVNDDYNSYTYNKHRAKKQTTRGTNFEWQIAPN